MKAIVHLRNLLFMSVIISLLDLSAHAATKEEQAKIDTLNELAWKYKSNDPEKAMGFAELALSKAKDEEYPKGIADAYNTIGIVYSFSDYEKAIEYFSLCLEVRKESGDRVGVAEAHNNIGIIFRRKGNHQKALENYLQSLKVYEERNDYHRIAVSCVNIGAFYAEQDNNEKALEYYYRALEMQEKAEEGEELLASIYNNIGTIFGKRDNYPKALEYYFKSLKVKKEVGNKEGVSLSYNNIAGIYRRQGSLNEAIDYYFRGLSINREIGNKEGVARALMNIGIVSKELGEHQDALDKLEESLEIAKEIGNKKLLWEIYLTLAKTEAGRGNFAQAYEYYQLYSGLKDELLNEESSRQIHEMEAKYETEKKEKQIEIQNLQLSRQQIGLFAFAGGLALVLILVFVIFRSYRQKKKANELLTAKNVKISQQNVEITEQKEVIEVKNRDTMASIRYAQNIQHTILPTNGHIRMLLPNSFVLFKPKDIVSGDFYWVASLNASSVKGGKAVLFAACDCTGHGVPGALMSMMINPFLNEAVKDKGLSRPADILYHVRKGIIDSLKQKGNMGEQKDGMDAALCKLEYANNGTACLQYAGGNNPLYIVRKGEKRLGTSGYELMKIPGDKQPVGVQDGKQIPFTNHEIELHKGDTIYIFSDGYVDQFGGPRNKKFMSKRFRNLLISIQNKGMEEQKKHLDKTIKEWMGTENQVDDILVIGVRV